MNDNEKNVMDILDIEVIDEERLERCTEIFKNMNITGTENLKQKDAPDVIFLKKE